MDRCTSDEKQLVDAINDMFSKEIPFNRVLGLKVESINYEHVEVSFQMRDELMGHHNRGMLHGGAISSVIDVVGGLAALMGVQRKMSGELLEARLERFGRVSTIDVRVDFLRPGIGKWFVATTCVLRTGKKIAVTRTELHNDRDDLIAVGTGSYVVA